MLVSLLAFRFCLFAVGGVRERAWMRESGGAVDGHRSRLEVRSFVSFRLPRGTSSCFLSLRFLRALYFCIVFPRSLFSTNLVPHCSEMPPEHQPSQGGRLLDSLKQSREAPGLIEILRREQKDASLAAKEPISTKCVCICHFERRK